MQASNVVKLPARVDLPFPMVPIDSERVFLVGRTGCGKTTAMLWLLARASFDRRPWVLFDYKREGAFAKMRRSRMLAGILTPNSSPPKRPGIYLVQPLESDDEAIDAFIWRIWRQGHKRGGGVGLVFDEALMAPAGPGSAIRACLTQGRSLKIPVIACSQEPRSIELDRYFLSQADHIGIFHINKREDRRLVAEYAPVDPDARLPEFHSWWYDVKRDAIFRLRPVPSEAILLQQIADRTPRRLFF